MALFKNRFQQIIKKDRSLLWKKITNIPRIYVFLKNYYLL